MKAIIEISSEYLEKAKYLTLAACKTKDDREAITRACEIAMETKDTISIDPHELIKDDEVTMVTTYIQFALLALDAILKQREASE